jgi:DNA-binding transcriptional LysR family regulator
MYLDRVLGMKLSVTVECNALGPLLELVKAHLGYTILPDSAVRQEVELGLLTTIPVTRRNLSRSIAVGVAREHPRTQAARRIYELVLECVDDLRATGAWNGSSAFRSAAAG